jgi:FtsH-binding integral membrane protein
MNNYPPQFDMEQFDKNSFQNPYNGNFVTTVSSVMKRVFTKMTLALVVSGAVAFFCANSFEFLNFLGTNTWAFFLLCALEIGIVIGLSAGINKLSNLQATLLFYAFAVVNGMTLAPIFLVYTDASIAKTFFITAATFGAMAVYGYCTNRDLSKIGSMLTMALFGLIIVSVVNIFLKSSGLDWLVSFVGVAIFIGLTAWDTQKIKEMAMQMPESSVGRLATLGALSLYLDFINIFLYLLRFFGNSRD